MSHHRLGIELSLPLGTTQTLQQQRMGILSGRAANDTDTFTNMNGTTRKRLSLNDCGSENEGESGSSHQEEENRSLFDDVVNDGSGIDIEEEDRVIMAFHHPSEDEAEDDGNGNSSSDHDDDDDNDDDDSLPSLSPPPTMPVLRLNLEKLCGYEPSNEEERMRLTNEIRSALLGPNHHRQSWSDDETGKGGTDVDVDVDTPSGGDLKEQDQDLQKEDGNGGDDNIDGDGDRDDVALDFIARSRELFEADIARHDITTEDCADAHVHAHAETTNANVYHATVPYPEFLPIYQHETQSSILRSTQQLWKQLLHPHKIDVVQRILTLLSTCSRDLVWKYEMNLEIRLISQRERQRKEDRDAQRQIRVWRKEIRPKELAKLYDVRETFELRLHASQTKYDMYVKERDVRVQRELRRRRENGSGGMGGIAGLDWDGKITFAFDEDDVDDVVQSMIQERRRRYLESDEDDDDGYHHNLDNDGDESDSLDDGDDEEESNDGSSSLEESFHDETSRTFPTITTPLNEQQPTSATSVSTSTSAPPLVLPVTSKSDRKKRRAAAAAKRQRKKLLSQKEAAMAADLRAKVEAAHAEEKYVRNVLISTDEKFAHATVLNLEKQLEKVDELIETLQEEEWKDEEEGLLDDDHDDDGGAGEKEENDEQPSILNAILAMILSAIPLEEGCDSNQHYSSLKEMHESILKDWRNEFGRLPPVNIGKGTKEEEERRNHRASSSIDDPRHDTKAMVFNGNDNVAWDDDIYDDEEDTNMITSKLSGMAINGNGNNNRMPSSSCMPPQPSAAAASSVPDDWEDTIVDDDWDDFFRPKDDMDTTSPSTVPSPPQQKVPATKSQEASSLLSLRPGGRRR